MTVAAGARADALDWALALARAPGERAALRQRPLPDGVDDLLQIAVGNPGQALEGAIARTGESEERLIEAARFYLREVLFHSGADAYRVLGLERAASQERVKAHHRWLQQWLHPDRHTSDWDAIFAGRVNAAWNRLRNEERRRAYDEENPAPNAPELSRPVMVGGAWVHQPVVVQTARDRWQRRAPVIALIAACLALGLLALRDIARDDSLVSQPVSTTGATASTHDPDALDGFGALRLPARAKSVVPQKPVPRRPMNRMVADTLPVGRGGSKPVSPPAPQTVSRAREERPGADATAVVAKVKAPVPLLPRAVAGGKTGKVGDMPEQLVANAKKSPALSTVAGPKITDVEATATPAAIPVSTRPPAISSERIRQAQKVGDRLLAFMRTADGRLPPIWDSVPVQQGATRLRDELRERGLASFSTPDWRVGEQEAHMMVDVRHVDGRHGRLGAGLAWREERWLVTRLTMERDW